MTEGRIPVNLVFNPNWWFHHYGISFDEPFYFDRDTRIKNDVRMRQAMHDRFGMGEPDPQPRPIIGSVHVAGGFVMPALFGATIRFAENEAPWPVQRYLGPHEIMALEVPDLEATWPMDRLIKDMDALEPEFGHIVGDFDTDGILNTALILRGEELFVDFRRNPGLVHRLFATLAEAYALVAGYMRSRTGTCAVATNPSILSLEPGLYLHSNCSVQMISPKTYTEFLLPYEQYLAQRLQPYGIHHCGENLHLFTEAYATIPAVFYDVGWKSDVAKCRDAFPDAFLNLRLSPVRMLQQTPTEVRKDTEQLLLAAGGPENVGVCCINMDYGTPDENIRAIFEAVAEVGDRLAQE